MKATVSVEPLDNYAPEAVTTAIRQLLAPLGGMTAFVRPGQRVLLKPNMLAGRTPEKAVTTHPEVVRAVIGLVQEAGGIVSVGDSPGVGQPRQVAERCGILAVIKETGATFAPFTESVPVTVRGGTFHQLELARDILDAEVIINLPKLKTHQMMGMTCGVKNLFGAVVGLRKPRLHLHAGESKELFARLLLELAERIQPALTLVDAVVAMEGDGPGNGDAVPFGVLLAGRNPLAVDTVAAHLAGLPPHGVWTQEVARHTGRFGARLDEVKILGTTCEDLPVRPLRPSKTTDIGFGLPAPLRRALRRSLSARPEPVAARCRACGICVESCPPQVMSLRGGTLRIDDRHCIRCFCCQELCPYDALRTRQGWLLHLAALLTRTTRQPPSSTDRLT